MPDVNISAAAAGGPALDDLFSDEEEKPKPATGQERTELSAILSDASNPLVMLTYYRKLFPFKQLFNWLSQDTNPTRNFTHREFALTLQGEVYIRYNSFATWNDLKNEICAKNPTRFEIGPVYTGRPKDRKTLLKSAFKPQLRELVFDIDMTDYDEIRTCCQDKAMCRRCWRFISMAVKVLDRALRDDFGFKHLLWVYSGRRGIHCWISDPAALLLTDEQRKAIVGYLEVVKGGAQMDKKVNLPRPLHPSLTSALETLRPDFRKVVLNDQNCFAADKQWERVLHMLPDKDNSARLAKKFPPGSTAGSQERWAAVLAPEKLNGAKQLQKYEDAVADIVLQYTYPRIDVEVSKKLNHLLKSPFCIHPGTGKVCVPLLASQVETFDTDAVPTVGSLLMELEDAARRTPGVEPTWEQTSLKPFVEVFEAYVKELIRDAREDRKGAGMTVKRELEDPMEF